MNLPGEPFNHFLSNDMEGLGLTGCQAVFQDSLARERGTSETIQDYKDIEAEEQLRQPDPNELDQNEDGIAESFPVT
jgi:hypothetical protein